MQSGTATLKMRGLPKTFWISERQALYLKKQQQTRVYSLLYWYPANCLFLLRNHAAQIMVWLVTGEDLGTLFKHRQAITAGCYPRCPHLPDALALLIRRCLAPRPEMRPAPRFLAQELRGMVDAWMADAYDPEAPDRWDQWNAGESTFEKLNALLWGW